MEAYQLEELRYKLQRTLAISSFPTLYLSLKTAKKEVRVLHIKPIYWSIFRDMHCYSHKIFFLVILYFWLVGTSTKDTTNDIFSYLYTVWIVKFLLNSIYLLIGFKVVLEVALRILKIKYSIWLVFIKYITTYCPVHNSSSTYTNVLLHKYLNLQKCDREGKDSLYVGKM